MRRTCSGATRMQIVSHRYYAGIVRMLGHNIASSIASYMTINIYNLYYIVARVAEIAAEIIRDRRRCQLHDSLNKGYSVLAERLHVQHLGAAATGSSVARVGSFGGVDAQLQPTCAQVAHKSWDATRKFGRVRQ